MRYQTTFQDNPVIRARIDTIIETGEDGLALPTGSAIFDAMLDDLASGVSLRQARMRGELIPPVQKVVDELFELRDGGTFGAREGS
jgi:hypothetical protein